jgi:DNA-binding beta-propeller fold protein YncE
MERRMFVATGIAVASLSACLGSGGLEESGGDSSWVPPIRGEVAIPAPGLGTGDGSPESVNLVVVVDDVDANEPTGIGFPPAAPSDLWIVNRRSGPVGTVPGWTIVNDVSTAGQSIDHFYDDSGPHFLARPSSITFSDEVTIAATCQDSNNEVMFGDGWMGPVAWTTDRELFSGGQYSHYDMAHEEEFCGGIAWDRDHVFWAFAGFDRAIDRIDYHSWHPDGIDGLGGEDHTDGEIWRYARGDVEKIDTVPSQMVVDHETGYVYVNDTGNGRIVRLDTTPEDCPPVADRWGEMQMYECDRPLEVVVPPGELSQPSGLALHHDLLYVTDFAEGTIAAYFTDGRRANRLDTGLGTGHLTGIAVTEEGVVYFADMADDRVYRIDPIE